MTSPFEKIGFDPEILGKEDEQKQSIRQKLLGTARKAARQIPFMEDVVAGYYCALDPATPTKVRGTLLAALAYFVLPLDAVPDFIIGLGFGDDATVLMATLALIKGHIRPEHVDLAREALRDEERTDPDIKSI